MTNHDKISNEFQQRQQELYDKYQDEYNNLCQEFLGKSLDAQICDKLNEILAKNLFLTPCGFSMANFDCNLYQPEIARIRDVLGKKYMADIC